MQIPGWLVPTLIAGMAFAYLWLVARAQHEELRALLARNGDKPTRGLKNTVGEILNWRTMRTGQYYLCAQNDLLAIYTSTSVWLKARVEVEFKEGRWAAESNSVYTMPERAFCASTQQDALWGTYSITLADGRRFHWQRHGTPLDGLMGYRPTTYFLADDQHTRLIRFKNTEVEVDEKAAALPELPLLVFLGSLFMIGLLESRGDT